MVARVVWDHEVAGSIPVTSTIYFMHLKHKKEHIQEAFKSLKTALFQRNEIMFFLLLKTLLNQVLALFTVLELFSRTKDLFLENFHKK